MDHVTKTLDYYYNGYISSSEKLRQFLDEYRQATNMLFTVRTSRSYIKMRAAAGSSTSSTRNSSIKNLTPPRNLNPVIENALVDCGKSNLSKNSVKNENELSPLSNSTQTSVGDLETTDKPIEQQQQQQQQQNKPEKITLMDSVITGNYYLIETSFSFIK